MTRALVTYTDRAAPTRVFAGFDPDQPVAGFYRFRMVSGGVAVAVRVWFGLPIDPVTGDELDRAPRWNASVNGGWVDLDRVWPACAEDPIDEAEAEHLRALQTWGAEHGHAAVANPRRRLDPLSTPLMF